jgi:hypothetical protein
VVMMVIMAVPTREVVCAPSELRYRERWEGMKRGCRDGGDDEKGKEEEWDRAVPYIKDEQEGVIRPVIGWQWPWAKDGHGITLLRLSLLEKAMASPRDRRPAQRPSDPSAGPSTWTSLEKEAVLNSHLAYAHYCMFYAG